MSLRSDEKRGVDVDKDLIHEAAAYLARGPAAAEEEQVRINKVERENMSGAASKTCPTASHPIAARLRPNCQSTSFVWVSQPASHGELGKASPLSA